MFKCPESEPSGWLKKLEKYKIQPSLGYNCGQAIQGKKVFNTDSRAYEAVDDRINFQLRRTRIGLKGQPYENLSFNFTVAIDLVGRDLLSELRQV
ncbi:MAG: hypothetical protein R2784_17045 [Saprospiraceae bacterium]